MKFILVPVTTSGNEALINISDIVCIVPSDVYPDTKCLIYLRASTAQYVRAEINVSDVYCLILDAAMLP